MIFWNGSRRIRFSVVFCNVRISCITLAPGLVRAVFFARPKAAPPANRPCSLRTRPPACWNVDDDDDDISKLLLDKHMGMYVIAMRNSLRNTNTKYEPPSKSQVATHLRAVLLFRRALLLLRRTSLRRQARSWRLVVLVGGFARHLRLRVVTDAVRGVETDGSRSRRRIGVPGLAPGGRLSTNHVVLCYRKVMLATT